MCCVVVCCQVTLQYEVDPCSRRSDRWLHNCFFTVMIIVNVLNEERSNLSCCTNIIRIMKQRNLAYAGEKQNVLQNVNTKI